jgi:hypothetical protein
MPEKMAPFLAGSNTERRQPSLPENGHIKDGKIIEAGDTRQLLLHPVHPYSRRLMQSGEAPSADDRLS